MRHLKTVLVVVLMSLIMNHAYSQQDAMFTHYMYNTLGVNPAYAGSRDMLTATTLHRSQWVGFDGAPVTQTLTLHSPIGGKHVGLGLSVINDKIGPVNSTSFYGDYAFRINLTAKSKLSFGLKAGLNLMSIDLVRLQTDNPDDVVFVSNVENQMSPNFGFGLYYSRDRFYAGISTPKLLENKYKYDEDKIRHLSKEQRHYFFIIGAMLKISDNIDIKPTIFVKVTYGVPIEADLTASFIFNKRFLLGAMYRTEDAVGILAGLDLTDQLHLGYSFDWSFGNHIVRYDDGSHEIMLRYDFLFRNKKRIRSPRYF